MTGHADPEARVGSFEGVDAVELAAAGYTATFLPELGLLGASLTFEGHEYLSLHGGVDHYRGRHTTGLPLLHPWANRLARPSYEVDGTWVDFDTSPPVVALDGLPIHGTMLCAEGWSVEAQFADSTRAILQARYVFSDHPEQLRSVPFPHDLVVFVELSDLGLKVTTTIHATGTADVPVSFGWHPYFTLPGVERRDTTLVLPPRDHLELDLHLLPNGNARAEPATRVRLADGSLAEVFDDAYRLVDEPGAREFALEGPPSHDRDAPARRLSVTFDEWYPYAQVYAPGDHDFVAIEPMTAPANALLTHDYRVVPPGESHSASFTVRVDPLDADPDPEPDPLAEPGSPPLET